MRKLGIRLGLALAVLVLVVAGCGDDGRGLYETAQFEERQNNRTHAIELYRQIVTRHPDGEYAQKASARLKELEGASGQP